MPGSCASRPPGVVPGQAFRHRLRGWERREIAQLASALGASGAVSFRVHGVHVNVMQNATEAGAEQQQGNPAAAPAGTTDDPSSRRQQRRQQRSAARAAAYRERKRTEGSSRMQDGNSQPHQAAAPQPTAADGSEQCSGQHGTEAKPRPALDLHGSPTRSPDRKRQALACDATDSIASGSFGVQVRPLRAVRRYDDGMRSDGRDRQASRDHESRDA